MQANLVVAPWPMAQAVAAFCRANPQACPLLACGEPGDPSLATLGAGIDVRTDVPGYLVHEAGVPRRVDNLRALWRDDLAAVAIGCWFGAEAALTREGVRLRHVELGIQGPLFRTNRPAVAAAGLAGSLVMSMRPFATAQVGRVIEITAGLPLCHGAPLHQGDPAALGIDDSARPDWGEPLVPEPGETALYWGCGLTALAALLDCRAPFFITHAPGCMLVTDLAETG